MLFSRIAVSAVGRVAQPIIIARVHDDFEATMRIGSPKDLENKTVVFVNCPNPFTVSYLPPYRVHYDLPLPKNMRILATGFNVYRVWRPDEKTLRLRSDKGNILENRKRTIAWRLNFFKNFAVSFRDCDAFPLKVDEQFELSGLMARVVKVDNNGRPRLVHYEFDRPLEDESLIWLQWD